MDISYRFGSSLSFDDKDHWPWAPQSLFAGLSINLQSLVIIQEPWIARVSHFASSGILQAVILSTSVLWILVRFLQRRNAATPGFCSSKSSSIKWAYELSSQAARASSVAFSIMAVAKGRIHYFNLVAISYTFVLGLLRLGGNVPWRQTALHQINWVLTAMLFLLAAAHFLPCIEIAAQCPGDLATAAAVASVAVAVIVAAITPRERLPSNGDFETPRYAMDREAAPEETCSWFNYYCTYDWLTPLIWKGATRRLDMSAIPSLAWYDEPMYLLRRLQKSRSVSANTLWTTLRFQRVELSLMALWAALSFSTENIAPYGMFRLLDFLSRPEGASFHPWIWVVLTFIGPMCRTVLFQQYVFTSTRLIVRIKSAMTQELYHRALVSMELEDDPFNLGTDGGHADEKNHQAGQRSTSSGRLANLMAADIDSIFRARDVIMCFVGVPIGTVLSLVGLYRMMGWASLVGITVILLATPLSASLGRAMFRAQRRVRKAQDGRISLVTEYLASIRAIKYFAWEDAVSDKVAQARILEQSGMWHVSVLQTIITQITQVFPYVGMLIMFGLHVGVGQHQLDASTAFTAIFLVKNIRRNIMMASNFSRNFASAAVAFDRLDRYFESAVPLTRYPVGPLRIEDASFRRNKKAVFRLEDISLDFVQGGLNVITGQSGSGKSTLLLAILGEAHLEGGRVTAPDDIAYASQSAWLQNDTIQANILFQSPMEEARYDRVIHACCLAVDLKELPDGDRTVVGENGTSLSGGQKSRVALARALYSKSPLLLLDDIFSALDAKTSAGVWKYCFCSDLLRGRTVVLVTQVPWISSQADLTVVLDKGRVQDIEQNIGAVRTPITIAEVLGGDDEGVDTESSAGSGPNSPCNISRSSPSASASPSSSPPPDSITRVAHEPSAKDIVNQEMKASGAIGRLASLQYMGYFGHPVFIAACLLGLIFSNFLSYGSSYWMSIWVEAYNKQAHVDIAYYLGIYAALSLAETALYGVVMIGFEWGAWRASRRLHNDFLRAVMGVSLSWFKTVPVGRVTNRFSGDMASIDMVLCSFLRATLDAVIMILFRVAAVSTIMPVFMLPALLMCVLGVVVGEIYTRTAVVIKRLTSSAQSPVFSQFADTLAGLSVIRARRGMDETFGQQLAAKLRVWSATSEANYNCNRWVAVRVDFGTALVALSASIIALHKVGLVGAGLVGFSLQNANGLSQTILMLVRAMNDLEVEMQSFHRIKEYVKLEQEDAGDQPYPAEGEYADEATCTIPKNWPASSEIEFRNVTIRYDEGGPDILTDVNLRFKAGERVAVVGRTGSGKSTLVLSLLRFTHIVQGQIFLDGIDISRISRRRLRESLSIIPQEATLFNGTVRSNLDPAGVVAEETLERALDNCGGIASFSGDEDGGESCGLVADDRHSQKISLETEVDARGDNFSHGQRQVLSLCRALIRRSKVMLLDEATASMDYETDRGMQEVLRRELEAAGGGRTLVTIAHRLRTIIDYDSVVVMSAGKVVEYGSPRDLYNARSQFYDMMYHSGELEELREMLGGGT